MKTEIYKDGRLLGEHVFQESSPRDDCIYRVRVRVTKRDWMDNEWLTDLPGLGNYKLLPSIDEIEFQFDVGGLSAIRAEERVKSQFERHGIYVLAIYVWEPRDTTVEPHS